MPIIAVTFPARASFALLVAFSIGATRAPAQSSPVSWSASARARGDSAAFALTARIATGWHLYSLSQPPGGPIATRISAVSPARIIGDITAPSPALAIDKSFGIMAETYDSSVTFRGAAISATGAPLALRVRFQTCDDRVCLPPNTVDVSVTTTQLAKHVAKASASIAPVRPEPAAAPNAAPPASPSPQPALLQLGPGVALDGPWMPFLWLAATTALLALLTPCVFPMVPITVAYFTRDGRTPGGRLREALLYALGIVAAFVAIGVSVATIFGAAGVNRLAADPWLNIALGIAFVVFALSLIGVVNVRVPAALVNRIAPSANAPRSPINTIAAALVFTLTSFTCTAPFVGTLLVAAAEGSWRRAVAGVAVFAMVFALPFVALAAAPALLSRLPRSGAWMNTLKLVLGVAELCAAVKFFANADQVLGGGHLTRGVVLLGWAALCLGLAIHLLLPRATPRGRLVPAMLVLVAAYLVIGAAGRPLGELEAYVPPSADAAWITDDYGSALRQASASGRRVFVDFTGYTCTNCRWMETNMFPQSEVAQSLGGFVRLRLYTDGRGPEAARAQAMQRATFRTVALPLYAVVDGQGHPVATFLGMTRDRAEFLAFLERARTP